MINPAIQEVLPKLIDSWWVVFVVGIIALIIWEVTPRYAWIRREEQG